MNYTGMGFFVGIAVMAVVTYVLRVGPLLLWERFHFIEALQRTLVPVPSIVLTTVVLATLAPYAVPRAEALPQYERIVAFATAMLVQYRWRNIMLSIIVGLTLAASLPDVALFCRL